MDDGSFNKWVVLTTVGATCLSFTIFLLVHVIRQYQNSKEALNDGNLMMAGPSGARQLRKSFASFIFLLMYFGTLMGVVFAGFAISLIFFWFGISGLLS